MPNTLYYKTLYSFTVETLPAEDIGYNTAKIKGSVEEMGDIPYAVIVEVRDQVVYCELLNIGNYNSVEAGVEYWDYDLESWEPVTTVTMTSIGEFSIDLFKDRYQQLRSVVVFVSSGVTYKSIANKKDLLEDTLWGFGLDDSGPLGQGETEQSRPTPVSIMSGSTFKAIAGTNHSIVIRSDNTLWGFGLDNYGQLGQGSTTTSRPTPVQILSGSTFKAIACGANHSLVIRSDNTLWGFGRDDSGQLGQGSTELRRPTPVSIMSGSTFKAIAGGGYYSLVIKSDNTLWGFGYDAYGQLGQGSTTLRRPTPVQILSGSTFKAISAEGWHSLVIRSDNTLWGFGYDAYGQLGQGSTTLRRPTPLQILSGSTFKAISGGYYHSVVIRSDNTLWGFGADDYGQLGQGSTTTSRPTPVQILSGSTFKAIAGGTFYSLVIKSDNTLWGFGRDNWGQLGQGDTVTPKPTPVQILSGSTFKAISCGFSHSLVIKQTLIPDNRGYLYEEGRYEDYWERNSDLGTFTKNEDNMYIAGVGVEIITTDLIDLSHYSNIFFDGMSGATATSVNLMLDTQGMCRVSIKLGESIGTSYATILFYDRYGFLLSEGIIQTISETTFTIDKIYFTLE